jgi:hypothetical protein
MVKAHFVPRKDGPASARKKNKPGWYKNKNGVPGMGIKKPSEAILAKDPIARAAYGPPLRVIHLTVRTKM